MNTNNHGGKRPGSGRKAKEKTVTLSYRVKETKAADIDKQLKPIVKELNK